MFTRFFIDRPIFATVLSIMITLAGGVAGWVLPIAQYPEITPPTVEVSAIYPGANASTVASTVAAPIEQQVNGVEDMLYMSSRSTNDGGYALTVTFKLGTDLNIAQVLVQNRVNLALPVLPDLVRRRGVTVKKKSPTVLMIVNLYSSNPKWPRTNLYLSNYATIHLRDELTRVTGVGDVTYLGQRDYSMRLWLDPEKMSVRGLSATDVVRAVEQQNIQVAAGQVGQPPAPRDQVFQYTINTLGRLASAGQFAEMILKTDADGRVIRIKDVARVELGAMNYDQTCTLDGQPSVALSIYQLPGSNALATAQRVRNKMDELRAKFPEGVEYAIVYDTTPFIDESVHEVFVTLRDAVILVALVMLVFLQSWRAAIIPLAAVPVAIVGSFTAMAAFGFSLNNLTLFGLVLAVGIVVDDAIVVVEAVQHHIDEGLNPRDATIRAMQEVAGPVVAVGLVLAAVFVPCVFITGIIGQFFRQFAVTIAVSTLISAFNSLTLSPALCALLLRREEGRAEPLPVPRLTFLLLLGGAAWMFAAPPLASLLHRLPATWHDWFAWLLPWLPMLLGLAGALTGLATGRWLNRGLGMGFHLFNRGFALLTRAYLAVVGLTLRLTLLALLVYGTLLYATYRVLDEAPAGFIPNQDKGYLLINVQLPDAASLSRTEAVVRQVDEVARRTPGVRHTLAIAGQSVLLGANAPNFGTVYVMLAPFGERRDHQLGADALLARLQAELAVKALGGLVNVFGAPPVDGLGAAGGFVLVVQDPADTGPTALQNTSSDVVAVLSELPEVQDVFTGFRADTPWIHLEFDRLAAKTKGVSVAEITHALQVYFGSLYVNDFNWQGRTWQVNVQADGKFRQQLADLKRLKVRSDRGEMVPLGGFLSIRDASGPAMVQRYNLYPSAMVSIIPASGVSSGQVIDRVQHAAQAPLAPSMRTEWTELALLQLQTEDTAAKAFVLAVVLAFLVLAAQYESWTLPLAIVLVVPLCLLAAGLGVILNHHDINVFTQIGFIVLVGLACKNAILIVEFGKQRRDAGADRRTATLAACRLRLRPIVMTSVAFILGVVPLVVAEGAGAEMRRTLGIAVFTGMTGVTLLGLILTPVFYFAIQFVKDAVARRPQSPALSGPETAPSATGGAAHG